MSAATQTVCGLVITERTANSDAKFPFGMKVEPITPVYWQDFCDLWQKVDKITARSKQVMHLEF